MAPPSIDTTITKSIYATRTLKGNFGHALAPQETRARSLSTASTSSSISIASPEPSSGNPSSSSLYLPRSDDTNRDQSPSYASSSVAGKRQQEPPYSPDPYDEEGGRYTPEPLDEYVLALHDFVPQQQNANTCLSFRAGEKIHVLNRDASGWWDGELDGRRGWFPSNYVNKDVGSLLDEKLPTTRVSVSVSSVILLPNQLIIQILALWKRSRPWILEVRWVVRVTS